jgi:hypothetical protein
VLLISLQRFTHIRAHIQTRRKTLKQMRDRHISTVMVKKPVIGQSIEPRTWRANVASSWWVEVRETWIVVRCWSQAVQKIADATKQLSFDGQEGAEHYEKSREHDCGCS